MNQRPKVVVVAPTVGRQLLTWLTEANCEAALMETFESGKEYLRMLPDLIVAEVKLGEYNGLHLALRARNAGIHAIVIGPHDSALERDARELRALYLQSPPDRTAFLSAVATLLGPLDRSDAPRMAPLAVTTVAEAESMWKAFTEPSADRIFGRGLPN